MPIYSFKCEKCNSEKDELRKMGDYSPPICCNEFMIRTFNPISFQTKEGTLEKVRSRSRNQGKKFFKRHPELQAKSESWKYPGEN